MAISTQTQRDYTRRNCGSHYNFQNVKYIIGVCVRQDTLCTQFYWLLVLLHMLSWEFTIDYSDPLELTSETLSIKSKLESCSFFLKRLERKLQGAAARFTRDPVTCAEEWENSHEIWYNIEGISPSTPTSFYHVKKVQLPSANFFPDEDLISAAARDSC